MTSDQFTALVTQHRGRIRFLYDQGEDPGLATSANTMEGACVVLCARWLQACDTGLDFSDQCLDTSGATPRLTRSILPAVQGEMSNYLAKSNQVQRERMLVGLMPSLQYQNRPTSTIWTPRAPISSSDWRRDAGEPQFNKQDQIGDGRPLRALILATRASVLIGVFDAAGAGHAMALWRGGVLVFFDPNYGAAVFQNEVDFAAFFVPFWQAAYARDGYAHARVLRFDPGGGRLVMAPWWMGPPPPPPPAAAAAASTVPLPPPSFAPPPPPPGAAATPRPGGSGRPLPPTPPRRG
ncbi:MAG TPA: YopT-type cysteine protease domain-containing protein [Gemmatimonadaceae bacterium]|nr:YopT-type cysteine protease domain-containing protein [Gemmatimonadaceae bacterium]